jgi:hypothetical protein
MNNKDLTLICELSILFKNPPSTIQGNNYSWEFFRSKEMEIIQVDTDTKEIKLIDIIHDMGMKYRTLQGIALQAGYTIGDYYTEE